MKVISLLNLYLIFVKIGAILLGGGYVIMPIIMNEFTEKRTLIDKDEVVNYFTLAQSLPGIIAANMSMFIGFKLNGLKGALVAMLGIITAPFFTIIMLGSIINAFITNQYLQAALWGVGIAVIALILLTIREIFQYSKKDLFFYMILVLAILLLLIFDFSPIKTILMLLPLGIIIKMFDLPKEVR
jgi:chromate transporter